MAGGRRRRSRLSWRFFLPRRETRLGLPVWFWEVVGLDGALVFVVVAVVGGGLVVGAAAAVAVVVATGGSCTLTCGTVASFSFPEVDPEPETAFEPEPEVRPEPDTISPSSVVSLSLEYDRSETELAPCSCPEWYADADDIDEDVVGAGDNTRSGFEAGSGARSGFEAGTLSGWEVFVGAGRLGSGRGNGLGLGLGVGFGLGLEVGCVGWGRECVGSTGRARIWPIAMS